MSKFEDFDIDLRENKSENVDSKAASTLSCSIAISTLSLDFCTKLNCGDGKPTGACNLTKMSVCARRK